jgi:hypothetical protein
MRKWLAIFAIAAVMAVGVSGQPNKRPASEQQGSKSEVEPESACQHDRYAYTRTEKADDHPPDWRTALERPEWWLVILGFGTLAVVLWQTVQTKKAAQAALLNAQAVIDAERAWLTVSITDKLRPLPDSPRNRDNLVA